MENSSIENQDHLPTKTPRRSLRLLPRAPPPSITIHHLPAELLFSVLELANSGQGWRGTAYNTFLRNAAVVCSSWSVLARELLWSEVFIAGQSEAVRLLASPALGRYKTRRLFISGDFNRNTACRVIKGVRGLQSLRLQNFTGADSVDRSWFSSAHLSGKYTYSPLKQSCGSNENFQQNLTRLFFTHVISRNDNLKRKRPS